MCVYVCVFWTCLNMLYSRLSMHMEYRGQIVEGIFPSTLFWRYVLSCCFCPTVVYFKELAFWLQFNSPISSSYLTITCRDCKQAPWQPAFYMGSRDQLRLSALYSEHLYPMSDLSGPSGDKTINWYVGMFFTDVHISKRNLKLLWKIEQNKDKRRYGFSWTIAVV